MKNFKRISVILLSLIMLLSIFPSTNFASEVELKDYKEESSRDKRLSQREEDEKLERENKEKEKQEKNKEKNKEKDKLEKLEKQDKEDTKETKKEVKKTYEELLAEQKLLSIEFEKLKKENEFAKRELQGFKVASGDTAAKKIPVLLYHHILPQKDIDAHGWKNNHSVISQEDFNAQMKYLKDNNYFTITAKEVQRYIRGEMKLPEKTVAITFDDAYLSVIDYAYPVMQKYGFKGTIFVIGDTIEREREEFDPTGLQRMYLPEKDLYKHVFEYESHTYALHDLKDNLTGLERATRQEIYLDTAKMKNTIESYILAYPGGRHNDGIIEAAKATGYTTAFTIKSGYAKVGTDLYRVPRVVIGPDTQLEYFKSIVSTTAEF